MKTYVKIDGQWVRTYRKPDAYDIVCWCCWVGLLATIGFLAATGKLA